MKLTVRSCVFGAGLALGAMGAAHALQDGADDVAPDTICFDDVITPVFVEHNVDELFAGGELQSSYKLLDYHFEQDSHYIEARAYFDDLETALLFGPYHSLDDLTPVSDDGFKNAVIAYLKRRYSRIEAVADEDGYALVWEWSADDKPDLTLCEPFAAEE